MKKTLKTLMLFAMATMTFVFFGCKKDQYWNGSYAFYQPIMNWDLSEDQVRTQMNSFEGWKEDKGSEMENELCYNNSKTKADIRYEFVNGKLNSSEVWYWGCNDKAEQLKTDWSNSIGLNWGEWWGTICSAKYPENHCDVMLQLNEEADHTYMIISFTYSPTILK